MMMWQSAVEEWVHLERGGRGGEEGERERGREGWREGGKEGGLVQYTVSQPHKALVAHFQEGVGEEGPCAAACDQGPSVGGFPRALGA